MDPLNHPLVLLLVGAAVSGILIPELARRWQLRQKELEIKIGLVTDISEATMAFVMSIQHSHDTAGMAPSALDQAKSDWEVSAAVIGTKLQAYHAKPIPDEWRDFAETVSMLSDWESAPSEQKGDVLEGVHSHMAHWPPTEGPMPMSWDALRNKTLERKSELIRKILDAKVVVSARFRRSWSTRSRATGIRIRPIQL